jgi:hypothetical protein
MFSPELSAYVSRQTRKSTQEVVGSIPISSTKYRIATRARYCTLI